MTTAQANPTATALRSGAVDWHTHVWLAEHLGEWTNLLSNDAGKRGSPDEHVAAYTNSAVGHCMVIALRSRHLGVNIPNQFVADFAAKDPNRRTAVASVDPSEDDALDQLDAAAALGMRGLKLSPPYQAFHPHDERAWRVYRRAAKLGMFLVFHQGWVFDPRSSLEHANPILLDRIAGELPGTPMIIAHLGQPWFWETIGVMVRRKNVFTDVSARLARPFQVYNAMMAAIDYRVENRILFGTDFPIAAPDAGIRMFLGINETLGASPPLPASLLEEIVYNRPKSLLGL